LHKRTPEENYRSLWSSVLQ